MRMWRASSEHNANLLSGHYRSVGLGVARGSWGGSAGVYVTADFGGRLDARIAGTRIAAAATDAAAAITYVPCTPAKWMIGGANPNEAANATSRAASLAAITRDRTASGVRRRSFTWQACRARI